MANIITNTNFEMFLDDPKPLMIDFWATWCGPCRALAPTVDDIEEEYAGRVTVAKCNVDDAEEIAMQFRVMSIPTLIFIKDGQVADKRVGLVSKEEIEGILNTLL